MTTINLVCPYCKNNVQWYIPEKGYDDKYICDAYPNGIPEYVEWAPKTAQSSMKPSPLTGEIEWLGLEKKLNNMMVIGCWNDCRQECKPLIYERYLQICKS